MISVLVPVYNEEKILEKNIYKFESYLNKNLEDYEIIIVDNNSKDKTAEIAKKIAKKFKSVRYINIEAAGKGEKIKKIILNLKSDYYAFIDADLPIELEEFLSIIRNVINNEADLVIASRNIKGGKSKRPFSRNISSRIYNFLSRLLLGIKIKDLFAGAKAWNRKINEEIWPKVQDKKWFFDAELIYYTSKKGYRIKEIPVTYDDTRRDSKFNIMKAGPYMGKSLIKLFFKTFK